MTSTITFFKDTAPGTPASGYGRLYAKSDGKLYFKNDDGTETLLFGTSYGAKGDIIVGTGVGTSTDQSVGTDGQALVADSSQTTGVRWATAPSVTTRQTQLAGSVDSSGYNNTISAGAGLNFNVSATATPAVFTFANGFGSIGSVDTYTQLTADASNQGALNASNIHFIHATRSSPSAVTWGQCLVPPDYGFAFDRTRGALLNYEGTNGATTTTDDFGNAWTLTGATISSAQSKFGSTSLDCTGGTAKSVSSSDFKTFGDGSWEVSFWFRINALPGSGADAHLFSGDNGSWHNVYVALANTAGTTKLRFALSSNGTSFDIGDSQGANTTWTLAQWNKCRIVFDALAGTYRAYLSLNAAAETQQVSFSSTARVASVIKLTHGRNLPGATSQFDGWFDATRFIRAASVTTTETPAAAAATIADYPYHWFSVPAMTMYEVTAASASSGTNPTLTQRNRVFVGEADTGATTVSAVRNYALRGFYISPDTTTGASGVQTNFNHNLGVSVGATANGWFRNITTVGGHSPGEILPALIQTTASGFPGDPISALKRNTVALQAGDQANPWGALSTGGVYQSVGGASTTYKMFVTVRRNW